MQIERGNLPLQSTALGARDTAHLRDAAEELATTFLSEMLKSAGLGETNSSFGGGIGEEQFRSFLREAQAREIVKTGGIGLSQHIFDALTATREPDDG